MNRALLISILVVVVYGFGCLTLTQPPRLHDEEIVLRVWDSLEDHYGSETFFECESFSVVGGRIEVAKPYPISDIIVAGYSHSTGEVWLFRAVPSNPAKNEFVIDGTSLYFNPCHENQRLFVAWSSASAGQDPAAPNRSLTQTPCGPAPPYGPPTSALDKSLEHLAPGP